MSTKRCDNCGGPNAIYERENADRTPTDRGTETRYYVERFCAECAAELGLLKGGDIHAE